MSVATENFLKTIYRLSQTPGADTRPGRLAGELNISNAAATDMARNLARRGLIHYEKYQELKLTEKGRTKALVLIRKHRLWEALLFKLFDINLGEIHREAELLEHQTSDFLAGRISDYLGNPTSDPHGDPIPDQEGIIPSQLSYIPVLKTQEGNRYIVKRLFSSEDDFFDFCETNGLRIDAEILVEKQYPSQGMTTLRIGDSKILVNREFASKIFVSELESNDVEP